MYMCDRTASCVASSHGSATRQSRVGKGQQEKQRGKKDELYINLSSNGEKKRTNKRQSTSGRDQELQSRDELFNRGNCNRYGIKRRKQNSQHKEKIITNKKERRPTETGGVETINTDMSVPTKTLRQTKIKPRHRNSEA